LSTRRGWKDAIKTEPRGILRRKVGAGHVTCTEEIMNAYRFFSKGLKGRNVSRDLRADGRIILKFVLE
jgi:hypothetical protein